MVDFLSIIMMNVSMKYDIDLKIQSHIQASWDIDHETWAPAPNQRQRLALQHDRDSACRVRLNPAA